MQHTVHVDELFAKSQKNTNESCKQDVCDTWQTADSDELFAMRNYISEVDVLLYDTFDALLQHQHLIGQSPV